MNQSQMLERQACSEELKGDQVRNRAKTTCTFLISQHLHLLRCKSLKTKKLAADLRLAAEAL
ncbi:MAG: hypothetical protein K940chlam7_01328, partial [Chlamydiae bacterium]|nr:hypothetical protein [Chlamydiota bacterium]